MDISLPVVLHFGVVLTLSVADAELIYEALVASVSVDGDSDFDRVLELQEDALDVMCRLLTREPPAVLSKLRRITDPG